LGLYALRPDPPDLLLAYQSTNLDITRTPLLPPASMPGIDLGSLEKMELEIVKAQPLPSGSDVLPTLAQESTTTAELPPLEPRVEPLGAEETVTPHTLDLKELTDMTLELDNPVNLGDQSAPRDKPPQAPPEEQPVYDLDLDDDLDELTLRPLVDESSTGGAADGEDVLEYTLEIEEDLEFEIEGLELEPDDDTEDEDDDKP